MPCRISENNGREMSGTVTSSLRLRSMRRFFAAAFGAYRRRSTAARTLRRVSGATIDGLLKTRETVAVDTPARLATSKMVATVRSIIVWRPVRRRTAESTRGACDVPGPWRGGVEDRIVGAHVIVFTSRL